jgi:hypothetical protein
VRSDIVAHLGGTCKASVDGNFIMMSDIS